MTFEPGIIMVRLFYTQVKPEQKRKDALHLAAHEMLRQCVLSCMTGITGEPARAVRIELSYGPHGKPYLKSHPALNISLSHAGEIALCAISENDIGADVQDHRDISVQRITQIASRFFSIPEQQALANKTAEEEKKNLFYRIWAAKETYAKLTGKGLAEDFSRFFADPDTMQVYSLSPDGEKQQLCGYLTEPFALPSYSVMLCTAEQVPFAEVEELTLDNTFTAVRRV